MFLKCYFTSNFSCHNFDRWPVTGCSRAAFSAEFRSPVLLEELAVRIPFSAGRPVAHLNLILQYIREILFVCVHYGFILSIGLALIAALFCQTIFYDF
jgi:hypothetical protein